MGKAVLLNVSGSACVSRFVAFDDKYARDGATYDPVVLAHLSWGQIAADLSDPSNTAGRAVRTNSDHITAAIRTMAGGQPCDVRTSTGVTSASGSI